MRLIMARVLYRFDLGLAEPSETNWLKQKVFLVWEKPSLRVFGAESAPGLGT